MRSWPPAWRSSPRGTSLARVAQTSRGRTYPRVLHLRRSPKVIAGRMCPRGGPDRCGPNVAPTCYSELEVSVLPICDRQDARTGTSVGSGYR